VAVIPRHQVLKKEKGMKKRPIKTNLTADFEFISNLLVAFPHGDHSDPVV
jgi:hypothetical protein